MENDYEPISGEIGLDFNIKKKAILSQSDFKDKFIEKAGTYGWQIDDENGMITDLDDCLEENVYSELFDCSYIDENCLLGYPGLYSIRSQN